MSRRMGASWNKAAGKYHTNSFVNILEISGLMEETN